MPKPTIQAAQAANDDLVKNLTRVYSPKEIYLVIIASCVGTLIEWYDFFVFASIAASTASQFYETGYPSSNVVAWLATNAIGFLVRPIGAAVFGMQTFLSFKFKTILR